MAINIENANFGYDANNLKAAIENLRTHCITETAEEIRKYNDEIKTVVDAGWKGASAEKFKQRWENDSAAIIKQLEDAGDEIEKALNDFVTSLANVDNNISF